METDLVGSVLDGRYRVDERLGRGGMASVYLAWQETLNRNVVVKVPHAGLIERDEFIGRFDREIQKLSELRHPRIVAVLEAGDVDGTPYLVMEYLPGGTLRERLEAAGKESPAEVLEWLFPVAEALDFVHEKSVIHRDVKPGNVLFDDHGNPFVADFGLAKVLEATDSKLTQSGSTLGTVLYMSPEAGRSEPLSGASDQYGLGIMVYEALTGDVPFHGDTPVSVMLKKLSEDPEDVAALCPDLYAGVAAAVMRSLSRDPKQRFASCTKFAREFAGALSDPTARVLPPKPEPAERRDRPGSRRALLALLLVPILLAAGYLASLGPDDSLPPGDGESGDSPVDRAVHGFLAVARKGIVFSTLDDRIMPEVADYLESFRHYRWFEEALQGRLASEPEAGEEAHLAHLSALIAEEGAGNATTAKDLRRLLLESAGPEPAKSHQRRFSETTSEFQRHLLGWLTGIEGWAAGGRFYENRLDAELGVTYHRFRLACAKSRVIPHVKPAEVVSVARALRSSLSPLALEASGSSDIGMMLVEVASTARSVADVEELVRQAKSLARPEGPAAARADAVLTRLGRVRSRDSLAAWRAAREALLEYLRVVIELDLTPIPYASSPTTPALLARRFEIGRELEDSWMRPWRRLEPHVIAIEGSRAAVRSPRGLRRPGWWDVLIDLYRARTADVRLAEFVEYGLKPHLAGSRLGAERSGDGPDDIYTRDRLRNVVLPTLLEFESLLETPALATSVRAEERGIILPAAEAYLQAMENH